MIPNSTTPSSLLWAHQLKREHVHLLARIKFVESAAAATAASVPSLATAELTSSAIKQLEDKVRLLEACRLKTSKENGALVDTVTTAIVVLDKLLARVSVLEAVVKSEGLEEELKGYQESADSFLKDMDVMRRTIAVLEAGKTREEDESKKLAKKLEDVDRMYKRMEDKLWAVENAISNVEACTEEDRAFMKDIVRKLNAVQEAIMKENARASMVVQALQGLNDTDRVIKKRAEGLEKRLADVEKRAEGLDVNITAVKSTEQNREPRRVISPARGWPPPDMFGNEGLDGPSNKAMVHVKATPIKEISKISTSVVPGNPDRNSRPHVEAPDVPRMHKSRAPQDFISQLRANPVRSLSKQSTQTESEIEDTTADLQALHMPELRPGLRQALSHQIVQEKPDRPLLTPLAAHHVDDQAKNDSPQANHDYVKHLAAQKVGAGVIRSEKSMQTRSRDTFNSPNVTRKPRPFPKRRTIALSPLRLSSPPPPSSSSKIEVGFDRRPEQSVQQQQPPQKRRRREILQTSPLS